jgi:Zn ribbon nucleic-acid-binding protein
MHGNKFDYSMANYVNSGTKVNIKCNTCNHKWWVTPRNFVGPNKSGCPECKRLKQFGRDNKTTVAIIEEIKCRFGDKFLYDRLVYTNCKTKVTVGCRVHGYFEKWPNDLKHGSGCPRCSGTKVLHEEFIAEMQVKHTEFDFSLFEYHGAKTPSTVICKVHGDFLMTPNWLKTASPNRGCAKCGPSTMVSTKIANGTIRDPKDIPEYEKYRREVWSISNQQFIEHYYTINPNNIRRGRKYHLDHKYSIQQGWLNKVPPEVIGGWKNLQIIPAKSNQVKSNKCSVTLESIL